MTWTILVLVLGIALYMFGGALVKTDAKKPSKGAVLLKKAVKLVAVLLMAGTVCRLYTPYYFMQMKAYSY